MYRFLRTSGDKEPVLALDAGLGRVSKYRVLFFSHWALSFRVVGLRTGVVLALCTTLLVAIQTAAPARPQDARALILQARNAWIAQDADALARLFTADGEVIVPGSRWRGRSEIRREVTRFAQKYKNVAIRIRRIFAGDSWAVVEWRYEDTERATGQRNRVDDAIVVDFKNGRIRRWREYFDTETPQSSPGSQSVEPLSSGSRPA